MPKPLLFARPSGLYARFLVPLDLRSRLGCCLIVRSLGLPSGDRARLAASCMGVALSDTFRAMRAGRLVDKKELDELLRKAALGQLRELTLENISLPNGERIGRAQVDTPHDAALLASLLGLSAPSSNETEPADQAAGSGWRNEVIEGQASQAVASQKADQRCLKPLTSIWRICVVPSAIPRPSLKAARRFASCWGSFGICQRLG